ncbi:SFXN4 protein, partial [Rhinopomastus cyanomelas]|nr:SFXN4 protein [Rhinopomastus cyanomelas]
MDANLSFWRAEGQSFFQRFLLWADVLDPLLLLKTRDEINRTRLYLGKSENTPGGPTQNDQTKKDFLLSLSSVHPDRNEILPLVFRPPAFLPICLPLIVVSSVQRQAKQAFLAQFAFYTYTTGFTTVNGNGTTKAKDYVVQEKQVVLGLGATTYAACIGALPLFLMNKYSVKSSGMQLIVKKILPAPIIALMSAFTAMMVRSSEFENGIEVMDKNGKVVGVSQKAGEKAVRETAVSRAVLFGTTLFLPTLLMSFVERRKPMKASQVLSSMRLMAITSVLTVMLPVSLSMFPQCGEIKRVDLEPEIQSSTEETELFYNRGI